MDRQLIVDAARQYLGTPFKKGGRSKTAIDCVGLLVLVGRDVGLHIEDTTEYSFNPEVAKFVDVIYSQSVRLPMEPLLIGSIGIFKQSIFPMHTGIIAKDPRNGQLTVINANLSRKSVVEQPMSEWKSNLLHLRDYKGI